MTLCKDCQFIHYSKVKGEFPWCGVGLPPWLQAALPANDRKIIFIRTEGCDLGKPKQQHAQD